jgi:Rrf2 family transcriptional regulator, iron-sulfur cluster assembly transcription factor
MRVTTWTEYSLIISIHLAKRGRRGSGPVAARELADTERLPADYVEQILLRLRRAGLVQSVRGAKGEHQTFEINCETHPVDADRCSPGSTCSIRPVWHALQQRVDQLLAGISLADLMKQESDVQELVGISTAS